MPVSRTLATVGLVLLILAALLIAALSALSIIVIGTEVDQPADTPTSITITSADAGKKLSEIAEMHGVDVNELIKTNTGTRNELQGKTAEDTVIEGQKLYLPSALEKIEVQPGDSLKSIAESEKVSLVHLKQLNLRRLELDPNAELLISPGQLIARPTETTNLDDTQIKAVIAGGFAVFILIVLIWLASPEGESFFKAGFMGGGGRRLSISKFQMWLWTLAFIFTYVSVYAARALKGQLDPVIELPDSLLILMGLSVSTFGLAKGVVSRKASMGEIEQAEIENPSAWTQLTNDERGLPEIARFQLLAWTLMGVGLYVFRVTALLGRGDPDQFVIPDVDTIIVALTLTSQGAYLAKRAVEKGTPYMTYATWGHASPKFLSIYGTYFGDFKAGNQVEIQFGNEWYPIKVEPSNWTKTLIKLEPDGTRGKEQTVIEELNDKKPAAVKIRLTIDDSTHIQTITLKLIPYVSDTSYSALAQADQSITVNGEGFAENTEVSLIHPPTTATLKGIVKRDSWNKLSVKFDLLSQPADSEWRLEVTSQGLTSNKVPFEVQTPASPAHAAPAPPSPAAPPPPSPSAPAPSPKVGEQEG